MSIQYVDAHGDATGILSEPFNITGSNDQFSIAIDGGSNQVFTLTHGSARTVANIVSDLSALTSATASSATISTGVKVLRIRTTSNSGASSTILVNTPSNTAHTVLGFLATTYTGGANINTTFSSSSKQDVISGIEDALNSAGWVTISGHHSTPCLVQSAMTPNPQNLRMRLRMTDGGSTCTILSIENVQGTVVCPNSTTANGNQSSVYLNPGSSKTWRVIANRHQAFVLVDSSTSARDFAAFGSPYLPSFLCGIIYDAIWLQGNSQTDGGTTAGGSFRTCLGMYDTTGNVGDYQLITNQYQWTYGNDGNRRAGSPQLISMVQGINIGGSQVSHYRWVDGSAYVTDPIYAWGQTNFDDEAMARGQLWDAFISTESYTMDTTLTGVDSHNWRNITSGSAANSTTARGTLWVVTP